MNLPNSSDKKLDGQYQIKGNTLRKRRVRRFGTRCLAKAERGSFNKRRFMPNYLKFLIGTEASILRAMPHCPQRIN
jgi:hypothetical protein